MKSFGGSFSSARKSFSSLKRSLSSSSRMLCFSGQRKDSLQPLPMFEPDEADLKLVVIGSAGIGKSALCRRFLGRQFEEDLEITDNPKVQRGVIKLEEGDQALTSIRVHDVTAQFPVKHSPQIVHEAIDTGEGFLLVYSITDRRSLLVVEQVMTYIQHVRRDRDLPIVLVANKKDEEKKRRISEEEGRSLAFEMGVAFYETSTKQTVATGHVRKIFQDLVQQIKCVRHRRDFERENRKSHFDIGLCGARSLIQKISGRDRPQKRRFDHSPRPLHKSPNS